MLKQRDHLVMASLLLRKEGYTGEGRGRGRLLPGKEVLLPGKLFL